MVILDLGKNGYYLPAEGKESVNMANMVAFLQDVGDKKLELTALE